MRIAIDRHPRRCRACQRAHPARLARGALLELADRAKQAVPVRRRCRQLDVQQRDQVGPKPKFERDDVSPRRDRDGGVARDDRPYRPLSHRV